MKVKRLLAAALTVALCLCFSLTAFAAEPASTLVSRETIPCGDGAVVVVSTYRDAAETRAARTSGYKNYDYVENGSTAWRLTVYGSFGSGGTCTGASYDCVIYNSAWSCASANASYSGNTATATATMTKGGTSRSASISISCDANGNLS